MGLSTQVLTAIHRGINVLCELAGHLERDKGDVVKAVQVLKRRDLVQIVAPDGFDRVFDAVIPPTRYMLTESGRRQAESGWPVNPGQGPRERRRTSGLRERAWWELRNKGLASLKQIVSTHADGSEKAADINLYKYLVALEKAGILVRQAQRLPARQSRGRVQWRLAIDLGLQAPVWRQKARTVYDPNSGRVYPIDATADEAGEAGEAGASDE